MKRCFLYVIVLFFVTVLCLTESGARQFNLQRTEPIKVGILSFKTGKKRANKKTVIKSTLLAINEINDKEGILERRIEPFIIELENDLSTVTGKVQKLIKEQKVSVIFSDGTPHICDQIKPVIEKNQCLLICPCMSERFEESSNIVSTGTLPKQQIVPAVEWCMDNMRTKFFIIGSETSFSKKFSSIIKDEINKLEGEILGEIYIPSEGDDFDEAMKKIIEAKPDVILNTISGESNIYFFINLRVNKIKSENIPVISFNITENEYKHLDSEEVIGNYIVKSYFQNIGSTENKRFIRKLNRKYGLSRITDDSVEAGYFGVYLWKQAVEDAETDNAEEVMQFLVGQNLNAPEGMVCIDVGTQHTWKTIRIGEIKQNKNIDIVWSSDLPLKP